MADVRLLTNHAQVLICVAQMTGARIRDIAECVGITERQAHRIVSELEEEGFVTRHRVGRRNFYEVHPDLRVTETADSHFTVGELLQALLPVRDEQAA